MFAANTDRIAFTAADATVALWRAARRRSPWPLGAALALAALVALTAGATPALAAGPCGTKGQFSQSGATATCTYTHAGTEDTFTVPAGVSNVSVTAIGAPGGAGTNGHSGGRGAKVSNAAVPVTPGTELWVDVGGPGADASCLTFNPGGFPDGGNNPACGGGGGGSSALLTAARASAALDGIAASDSRLLVAGGGGGGGQAFDGGSAGDPAATGAGAGGCVSNGGGGGVGPTDATGGGGAGGCVGIGTVAGGAGTAAMGGVGAQWGRYGGGGGGGWFGGGGGGGAVFGSGGAGGGGGSSYAGAGPSGGITITTASSSQAPEVTVSYSLANPDQNDNQGNQNDQAQAPPAGPASTASVDAAPAAGLAAPPERAIAQLRLASRCVRPSRSGRVRIGMSLRLARPGPLRIRIDRAIGGGIWQSCHSPNPQRRFSGRFERVATLSQRPGRRAAAAASVARRLTLKLKLAPGLYRISVRAKLDHDRLSRPARRYLRVLG
jgi:Glycine rich protein